MIVVQRFKSVSCRLDLILVIDGHVSRQGVDQIDDVLALSGNIALGEDHAVEPAFAALSVGTEVDIVVVVGIDGRVVTLAVGIPYEFLARLRVNYLEAVGGRQRDVREHILALGRGVCGELIGGGERPVVEGAYEVVALHKLRDLAKDRGEGRVAGDLGEVIRRAVGVGAVAPAGEYIGVVVALLLYGSRAVVARNCVCGYVFIGFEDLVAVLPSYGVGGRLGGSFGGSHGGSGRYDV